MAMFRKAIADEKYNMALSKRKQGNFQEAIEIMKEALEHYRQINYTKRLKNANFLLKNGQ